MERNKQILKHCPNFYKIMNFEYFEDDYLSEKIVSIYEDFVFKVDLKDSKQVKKIEQLDLVVNRYIDDYFFRKELKSGMMNIKIRKNEDILTGIVNWILNVFENYEIGYTRNIYFSRWI